MSAVSQVHKLLADLGGYFVDDSTQVGSLIGRAEAQRRK